MSLSIVGGVGFIVVLMVTVWVGRMGATLARGLLLGVVAGAAASLVVGFAVGLLQHLLPMGQIDFWLSNLLRKILSPS